MGSTEKYELIKDLGSGNFGVARLMRNKKTGELVAVKFIERGDKIDKNVEREIVNHRMLRHPNIIGFKEVRRAWRASDADPHDRGWASHLVLVHLPVGCTVVLQKDGALALGGPCASPAMGHGGPIGVASRARGVLKRTQYDGQIADVWSCGVTLYVMLVGAYPFEDPQDPRNFRKTIQRIMGVRYSFPTSMRISVDCMNLIQRIFVADPGRRIRIPEIKKHPWYVKNLPEDLKEDVARTSPQPEPHQSVEDIQRIVSEARVKATTTAPKNDLEQELLDEMNEDAYNI
eukprot:evm.model.scf_1515EXC.4 EVM.evm.TU.scf_1515EXC.4   scf_1515EXC:30903-34959(+)